MLHGIVVEIPVVVEIGRIDEVIVFPGNDIAVAGSCVGQAISVCVPDDYGMLRVYLKVATILIAQCRRCITIPTDFGPVETAHSSVICRDDNRTILLR